ncbi:MAG TPA: glucoamylase family protein, partial [Pyrinomonadaceae bacterium]
MVDFLSSAPRFKRGLGYGEEQPIRDEIFSVERLEQYAQSLAAEHKIVRKKGRALLLPRLRDNGRKLVAVYQALVESLRQGRAISPAAEWLVDNFHIVEDQLREIREDLPKTYYYELPKLAEGELKDYPRIYAVALALIAHTDSRLDSNTLRRFIASYQTVSPLTIGEVWAVAITLRLVLVENLRRLALLIQRAREEREQADKLADKLLELAVRQPSALVPLVAETLGKRGRMPSAFVMQLVQRLREQDPSLTAVTDWLEKRLAQENTSIELVMHAEHQRQAATQVTVGDIITSMRLLSALDWRDFFESVSLVDPILGEDPARVYLRMEFATRDRYRHVIERISKKTGSNELDIAKAAVGIAAANINDNRTAGPRSHVGYYLVDAGLSQLEATFSYRPPFGERWRRFLLRNATLFYLGTLMLLTVSGLWFLLYAMHRAGAGWLILVIASVLALVPTSDLVLSILNWDITHFFPPRLLPRMETEQGIPDDALTMVVVPTIFFSEDQIHSLLGKLEVHYLANQDAQLYFGLLGDFADADAEELPADSKLLELALSGIEELNRRYPKDNSKTFHLFHRRRRHNPNEAKWLGWERKRGKLREFNQLLRGSTDTSFMAVTADAVLLKKVRYVITLDSDTHLPRDAARKLVGTTLHPLNRPHIDPSVNRVTYGYGILQPRVSISLESANQSRFARTFSGMIGLDPYTTAVSDVYQDFFGEGNYTGKGLYDVDAFEASLAERVPDNSLLSHDLFESLFARAALITDIELFDDYPARYDAYAKRLHRWTRGDWQILRWLFPYVRDGRRRRTSNDLPLISRWKILDNLRRSLIAPSMFLWLIAAWTIFPGSTTLWSLLVIITIAFPVYFHLTTSLLVHPRGSLWSSHFRTLWREIKTNTAQTALSVILLAHQAYLMTDAVVRTMYRKLISRRNLLEWVTAAQAEQEASEDLPQFLRLMWPAVLLAAIAAFLSILFRRGSQPEVWFFVTAWASSPFVAYWFSQPLRIKPKQLIAGELAFVRLVARRTWRFFETFVGPEDNWLPPDNFQEDPVPVVAHRTSPTNIALLLLSTGAAHDFGYLSTLEFVERVELTFRTLSKLTKFRGHLFNWYDTVTLAPLEPQYISTVDSGNLASHLIALRHMCIELADQPLVNYQIIGGLRDTIAALSEEVGRLATVRQRTDVLTVSHLRDEIERCKELASGSPGPNMDSWFLMQESLNKHVLEIKDIIDALSHEHGVESFRELQWWLGALRHQVDSCLRDVNTLAPWVPHTSAIARVIHQYGNEAETQWHEIEKLLVNVPTISAIPEIADKVLIQLAALQSTMTQPSSEPSSEFQAVVHDLAQLTIVVENAVGATKDVLTRLARIAQQCEEISLVMDFEFLFDHERKLFTIGFNVSDLRPDNSYYDLLASEARMASFVAIARGNVQQEHWFRLGRQLTAVNGDRALISWTGTMFEYLMPLLITRNYEGTLLAQTYHAVVARQIEYGLERRVPWGISESAYNVRDLHFNYQYDPFGVPGLGLKRGLIEDLVVAPYATMLAAMISPREAVANLRALEREGALGKYGYYESIDYTSDRLPQNQKRVIVRAFMTHHQGMSLVALDNTLHQNQMESRFHADPLVQATELLLQERIPSAVRAVHPRAEEVLTGRVVQSFPGLLTRTYSTYDLSTPGTQLLSNGTYNIMLTTSGAGFSACGDYAVTRWREDATRDNWGTFIYLRDVRSGTVWSAGYQPVQRRPQAYEVAFAEDKVDFWRSDNGIFTHTQVVVSGEDNAEVRFVSITNDTTVTREIEVTSYAEVVLASASADAAHPVFSNLFIETEFFAAENSILAHRRRRSEDEEPVWGVHSIVAEGDLVGAVQYETDRARFLGRGHTPSDPVAVIEERPLSNTTGAVLDPIFSLRARVRLRPNETARISFSTALAHSRQEAMTLADKYHDPSIFDRQARLAWTKAQVEMNHLRIDAEEAHLFQRLATRVIFSDPSLRPRPHVLAMNTKAQSGLWPYALSGDLPIMVVRVSRPEHLDIVRKILRGHEYLHYKGLKIDLVILNDYPASYMQSLQRELETMIRTSGLQIMRDKPGGVFLRRADIMPEADRILLHSVAR